MKRIVLSLFALLALGCAPADAPPSTRPACPELLPPPVPADFRATLTLETELGVITIELDGRSPHATGSLVALVRCGAYDGSVFHRIVPGFVIQGGDIRYGIEPMDPQLVGSGGPSYRIPDDPVVPDYRRGTVGLARSGERDSGGSQFYIALDDASARDSLARAADTAILGEVIAGMELVDAIAARAQDGSERNLALDPVVIVRASIELR